MKKRKRLSFRERKRIKRDRREAEQELEMRFHQLIERGNEEEKKRVWKKMKRLMEERKTK